MTSSELASCMLAIVSHAREIIEVIVTIRIIREDALIFRAKNRVRMYVLISKYALKS